MTIYMTLDGQKYEQTSDKQHKNNIPLPDDWGPARKIITRGGRFLLQCTTIKTPPKYDTRKYEIQ